MKGEGTRASICVIAPGGASARMGTRITTAANSPEALMPCPNVAGGASFATGKLTPLRDTITGRWGTEWVHTLPQLMV